MSYSTFYLNSQSSDGIIDGSNVIIGGNVGIQTNTPEYSLDINGTFRSSSIVTPNLNTENIILTDSSLNPYSIQSRIEHTKLVENIVTVRAKTSDAANSSGSSSAFFIDSIETPYLHFTLGKKYRFIQTDSTNTGHPLRFYLDEGKTTQFTTNVTVSGTPGVDSTAYVEISVTSSTPQILYYQCSSHSYMGNTAYSKSTGGLNNISVNDLSDVSFNSTTAEDGNALVWNATSGEWEAGTIVSNKPAFQGVDLSGYDLLLKFTENIKNVSTYDPTDFTVNVKSVNRSVDSIAIANGDVNLIMDTGGQTGGVETLIGGLVGGAIDLNVDGSIEDSRLDHYLRGLSFYGDYLYVGVPRLGKIRRFNIVTQIWSTFIPHNIGNTIGGMTRDGINFYVVCGTDNTQALVKFPMNYNNPSDTYANRVSIYNQLPLSNVKSFTMSNDGAYIYFGITDGGRRLGITRYTISTGVFEYYKTGGLTTNSYSSNEDYLLYNLSYKYNIRLAIDDNYLYFGYNWWQYARNKSKIGRISLSTDVIEMSWKTEDSTNNSWFVGSSGFPDDDNSYQSMVYKDGYLYFSGPSSTGKIVKTSVNDSTNAVTEVGDYVGHIAIHPTLPYLYFAGFYSWGISYNEPSRKGTVWQLTLDVPSYQTFDPITSVDNLTIKYVKNSTSSKNLLGDPSEFAVDNFNYVGTDITGIINGADISFNVIDVSAIFIQGSNVSTVLNSKQATIEDGDLTIARTNGLQAALDAKVESAALINLKPTLTILDLSSGDILLNFTEGIKDVATYDKDDFVLTNEGTVITGGTISVENNKVKFAFSSGWREDTSVGSTKSWWGITSSADGTKLAATVQGGNIWTSTDSGASWTSRAASRNWYNGIASSTDGTKLVASANNGNIWTSTDSGVNWTSRASVKYWVEVASSSDGTKLAAVVYNGNIWTSTDSGVNWTEQSASFGGTKQWYGIASSADGTKLAAVVSGGNIWTSTNSGVNWTEQSASFGGTKIWRAIASSADGSKLAAAAYGGNLWTSSNSGVTWTEDTTVNATKNWRGIASSADGTKLVAAPNGGNLWTFESVEAPNITDVQNLTVKYTKSATANKNLLGKDSDVAVDSFDFIGTNRIQATITETIDVSLNNLKVHGDLSANDASFNVIDTASINVTGDYQQNGANINTIYATIASPTLTGTPTAPTASSGTNTTQLATTAFVSTAVSNLVNGAPGALDTLSELASALDNSGNFATNVTNTLGSLQTQIDTKQATLTFNAPSSNNTNPSTSAQIKTALDAKQDTLTAGTNITITGTTISASGGGGGGSGGLTDLSATSINDLSDVSFNSTTTTSGKSLIWDASNNVWEVGTPTSTLTQTVITQSAPTWSQITASSGSPNANSSHNGAIHGDYFYVFGGGNVNNLMYRFHLTTRAWNQVSYSTSGTILSELYGSLLFSYGDYVYCIFGSRHVSGYPSTNTVLRYNTTNNTLYEVSTSGTTVPTRQAGAIALYNDSGTDYLYYFGGRGSSFYNDMHRLNLSNHTWSTVTTSGGPPDTRYYIVYTYTSTKLYIYGGDRSSGDHSNDIWEFNLTNNTWSQLHDGTGTAPVGSYGGSMLYNNNYIYIFGGHKSSAGITDETWKFNLTNNTWSELSLSNTPGKKYSSAYAHDSSNNLYIHGGYNDSYAVQSTIWKLTISDTSTVTTNLIEGIDVNGDISFNGNLYQNGALFVGGSTIDETTDVSVNNLDVSGNLKVDGNGIFSGTVQASGNILSSDDRLKHNEVIPTTPLESIMKLTPKQYFKTKKMYDISHNFQVNSNGIPINTNGNVLIEDTDYTKETGIIAQELQLIPELKYTVKNNNAMEPLGVDYNSIFCTHIAATKQLYSIINNQKSSIESQQQEIETVKLVNQDINQQLNDVLNENNRLKNDIQFIKNYLGIN